MIVPQYWAEGRIQHRERGRQVTLSRFGWSDVSQSDAQSHADSRAQDALQRVLSGEKLARREPKVPYNGAAGVPIREEIISRHGETVITRNAYGAHCLNTPNVLFADIDFQDRPGCQLTCAVSLTLLMAALLVGWLADSAVLGGALAVAAILFGWAVASGLHRAAVALSGGIENAARRRITTFVDQHPTWNVAIYRTPAGLRVLATHQTFEPRDPIVAEFFNALHTDPLYARMCFNQNCFRARVSPKPWRIGIAQHMKPRPGVWPISPDKMPERSAWIAQYEQAAKAYAACRQLETVGSGRMDPDVRPVRDLHDQLSGAVSGLPIA